MLALPLLLALLLAPHVALAAPLRAHPRIECHTDAPVCDVQLFDQTDALQIGNGKATLVVQTINGRFHPSLLVRDNAALAPIPCPARRSSSHRAPARSISRALRAS